MPAFQLFLHDLVGHPDDDADFDQLDPAEVKSQLQAIYGFLGNETKIAVEGDTVTVSIPDPHPFRAGEALRELKRAQRAAEKGNYTTAVRAYREALSVFPALADGRRELAMALMEIGELAEAREELIRVLRLRPEDAWGWLVLGNIANKQNDAALAHRYYQRAYQLAPDDLYVLNSFASLQAQQGNLDGAVSLFDRALTIDPDYPNARYGLALSYDRMGSAERAATELRDLLARPRTQDVRSSPVYQQAQALYLDLQRRAAEAAYPGLMDRLRELALELEQQTGIAVRFQEDDHMEVAAAAQVAWVHGRSEHLIRYRPTNKAILPHRIAHELEHLRLIHEARDRGRNRLFTTTPATMAYAFQQTDGDGRRLRQTGMDEASIQRYLTTLISGLANQLFNNPLDMVIEDRLHRRYPFLQASQYVSVEETAREGLQAVQDASIRNLTPSRIYAASAAMNAAYALFLDHLWGGITEYARPYEAERSYPDARRLLELWRAAMPVMQPGDEYDLVDRCAQALRLQNWYAWLEDEAGAAEPDPEIWADIDVAEAEVRGIAAERELFRQKNPAALMYLLGAMERFDGMPQEAVLRITAEMAMLGRTGFDYNSPERKYSLAALPGESFSGLQLMCMMYVGLKRTAPDVDPGLPFADVYQSALALHQGRKA